MEKPRRFYTVLRTEPVHPVFALGGRIVGLTVTRDIDQMTESGWGWGGDYNRTDLEIVLPAEYIQESAEQLPPPKQD